MINLRFLSDKLTMSEIRGLENRLEDMIGESINKEYWQEIIYFPYLLTPTDEERLLYSYDIKLIEDRFND